MANGQWYEDATSVQIRQWATIVTIGVAPLAALTLWCHSALWPAPVIGGGVMCGGTWLLWLWKRYEERKDDAWHKDKYGPKGRP